MQKKAITNISATELPEELKRLHTPPASLWGLGNTNLLAQHPRVGIVGARKFTPYGKEVTASIASTLARAGVVIVSGLALGVDSIAHRACLEVGGKTIAVLPSGIEYIYPASHTALAQNISSKNGLLLSEYPAKFKPFKHSFIERNRIIAALSDVLIITEAATASGSLHTAYFALDLGVPIMAVPGNITSPYSAGTNQLIRTGAQPLLDPQDVLDLLGIQNTSVLEYIPENETEKILLDLIKSGVTGVNDVISTSKLEVPVAQTYVTMLEMKGVIAAESGHWKLL